MVYYELQEGLVTCNDVHMEISLKPHEYTW